VAHIQDRGKQQTRRWQARYRDPSGREKSKTFRRKTDAQRWLDEVTTDFVTGRYVDPRAGRVTFETFVISWLAMQTTDVVTREAVESRVRNHLLPTFGAMELRNIRPSTVQAWLRDRAEVCSPSFVRVQLANLSSILGAAVEDGVIHANPCSAASVKPPRLDGNRVVPWTRKQVEAVVTAHPERYRAVAITGAGLGLRQGELFGLRVEDVDFLRRRVLVRQQVKLVKGRPILAPPKGRKEREVPLPDVVAVALSEHLRTMPARDVTLPWRDLTGEKRTATLVFTSRESGAIVRNHYNPYVWKPALTEAGIEPTRANGMHALRHYYASALLDGGVSIRAVAEYLGHSDPGFTLRTYAHLMPEAEDRARSAVEAALGPHAEPTRNEPQVGTQSRWSGAVLAPGS
jgi:integrase